MCSIARSFILLTLFFLFVSSTFANLPMQYFSKNLSSILNIDQSHAEPVTLGAGTQNAAVLTNVNITTPNTIRYLQLFFYDNTSGADCAGTLLGVASILDNNLGQPLIVGTRSIYLPGTTAYALATAANVGVDPAQVRCMQLYLSGNPESINTTNCQAFTDESCSSITQLCLSNQTYNASWSSSNSACRTPYVYITSNSTAGNSLFVCTGLGGTLTCNSTGPNGFTNGLIGNIVNDGFGYFMSGTSTRTLYQCPITASTGAVSSTSCITQTSFAGDALLLPRGLAISNNYLYILDQTNLAIYGCPLSNGLVSDLSCIKNPINGLSITDARGITIQNGNLYMTASNGIFKCTASAGSVTSCQVQVAANVNSPRGITFYNNNLYYVNNGTTSVRSCNINPDGTIDTCIDTGFAFNNPNGIIVYAGTAYIVNQPGSITRCAVDNFASPAPLSGCTAENPTIGSPSVGISYF